VRIAFFIAQFGDVGGSARFTFKLAQSLGPDVEALAVFPAEGISPSEARRAGLETVIVPAPEELNRFGKLLARVSWWRKLSLFVGHAIPYARRLAAWLRAENVDVLHCSSFRGVMIAGLAGRLAGIPVVWDLAGRFRVRGLLRWVPPLLANRIVLIAKGLAADVPAPFRRKCRSITKGFEPGTEAGDRNGVEALRELVDPERPVVACFSTITPFKGYHHLIAAARRIRECVEGPPPIFLGVSAVPDTEIDQRYRRHLDELVERHELRDFHFVGWQREPWLWFQRADIVVLPSVDRERLRMDGEEVEIEGHEGWGRVLSEAMWFAKPVVASDIVGVREQVIDGETALLVPPGDAGALADALVRLLDSDDLRRRLGEAGRRRVTEDLTIESEVAATTAMWKELVG
jgi:glycosyltransferase involved in cell wall biosynthesis